jgi:hypothetical protein
MSRQNARSARQIIMRNYTSKTPPNVIGLVKVKGGAIGIGTWNSANIFVRCAILTWSWEYLCRGLRVEHVVHLHDVNAFCDIVCRSLRNQSAQYGFFRFEPAISGRIDSEPGSFCACEIRPYDGRRDTVIVRCWHLSTLASLRTRSNELKRAAAYTLLAIVMLAFIMGLFWLLGAPAEAYIGAAVGLTVPAMMEFARFVERFRGAAPTT